MWASPIYKFKTYVEGKKKNIFIDVTGSAPNFSKPGKQLEGTFEALLKGLKPSETKILDFGAAKLRNTIHLLEEGYNVYSCEFDDLFKRSKQASDYLKKAEKFSNFKRLVFPEEFIGFDEEFDVVLLINVLNIMPVPLERLCVLALCREKMKKGGKLLWYTQHGAYSKSDSVAKLFDGLVTGKGRNYHMFYRDFSRDEIHELLISTGFSFNKEFKFPMSGSNQAYVFSSDGAILVDKTLGLTELLKRKQKLKPVVRGSYSKKETYETQIPKRAKSVEKINILETFLKELSKIPTGRKNANKYHRLIFSILKSVFDNSLRKPEMEEVIAEDTQRVDITFSNHRDRGFFKQLARGYGIKCPNIFIECKNYKEDPTNPEFAQIQSRLNRIRGQFGILTCRKISNANKAKKRQENIAKDEKYVIILVDSDIEKIVKWKLKGEEEKIDDHLEKKFKKLI